MSDDMDDDSDHDYTREDKFSVALAVAMFLAYMAVMIVMHEVRVGWT